MIGTSVLLLFLLLLPAAIQPPGPEKLPGGPCADPADHRAVHHYSRQFDVAVRRSEFDRAAELGRQMVRAYCAKDFLWWRYLEALAGGKRYGDAVAVLEYLFPRDENDAVYSLARPGNPFQALVASPEFRQSPPARRLDQILREAEQRRAQARERLAGMARPPEAYVATGICPFECCHYGEWTVTKATDLFDAPGGSARVARLLTGQKVEALDGEVHLRPPAVLVRWSGAAEAPFPAGAILFLAGYTGEGWGRIWHEGRVVQGDVAGASLCCPSPGRAWWGEFLDPADRLWYERAVWRIRIRAPNGRIGWTRDRNHFTGNYGCG